MREWPTKEPLINHHGIERTGISRPTRDGILDHLEQFVRVPAVAKKGIDNLTFLDILRLTLAKKISSRQIVEFLGISLGYVKCLRGCIFCRCLVSHPCGCDGASVQSEKLNYYSTVHSLTFFFSLH